MVISLFASLASAQPLAPDDEATSPTVASVIPADLDPDRVLARARGIEFTAADWSDLLERYPGIARRVFPDREAAEQYVQRQISAMLAMRYKVREAERLGLDEDPEIRERIEQARLRQVDGWARDRLLDETEAGDAEIEAFYEENIERYDRPDALRFRQIFLDFKGLDDKAKAERRELAERIATLARDNPTSFPDLAAQYSESAAPDKAKPIGPVEADRIAADLRDALWSLEADEIGGPVESPFGLHLFQVVERIPQSIPLEQARASIRRQVRERKVDRLIDERAGLTGDDDATTGTLEARGRALIDLARERGWDEEPEFRRRWQSVREQQLQNAYAQHELEAAGELGPEAVRRYYEENRERFIRPEGKQVVILELRPGRAAEPGASFSHRAILERAEAIRDEWEAGADFRDLIRRHSTAPDAEAGGEPQWIYPGMREPVQYEAVADLPPGEASEPIRLEDGYLLVQVLAEATNIPIPLEEVEAAIERTLLRREARRFHRELGEEIAAEIEWSLPPGE